MEQQLALLVPFQRLFRYWHLLHLPLWCALMSPALLLWRAQLALAAGALPSRWTISALLLAAAFGTWWSERTLLGKEAGLFVTSGTMGNQLAIRVLTEALAAAAGREGIQRFDAGVKNILDTLTFQRMRRPQIQAHGVLTHHRPETIEWIDSFAAEEVLWDVGANVGV